MVPKGYGHVDEARVKQNVGTHRDQPARHTRYIEQVVHQLGHVTDLARDDAGGLLYPGFVQMRQAEQFRRGVDRRQRIAQFMGEHGKKFILAFACCLQLFFGSLDFGYIGVRAEPLHDLSCLIPQRRGAAEEGAKFAACGTQGKRHLPGLAAGQRCPPSLHHHWQQCRVLHRFPSPAQHLVRRRPGVGIPAIVVPMNMAVRVGHPREVRNRIGKLPQPRLARPDRLGRAHRVRDVAAFDENAGDLAAHIANRLVHEIEKTFDQVLPGLELELDWNRVPDKRLAGLEYLVE